MKRILRIIILLVLFTFGGGFLFSGLPVMASEEQQTELDEEPAENEYDPGMGEEDSAELSNGYLDKVFHEQIRKKNGRRLAPKNNASKLDGMNYQVYMQLYQDICAVAAGERESTVFTVELADLSIQTSWTAEELGVSSLVTERNGRKVISAEAKEAVNTLLGLDVPLIIRTLLADCPYELYWYDKTESTKWTEYGFSLKNDVLSITGPLEFKFPVSSEYARDLYVADSSFGTAVQDARNTAVAIVQDYAELGDFEKLDAYRERICGLVSYADDAIDQSADYGNPWQIIWVFDEDPDTNVVCEGYSKAFQYLCDLSTFENEITACSVTGGLDGGPHMWNLVRMEDGRNYLVDITNCDTDTIGEPDYLFMMGTAYGTVDTSYAFTTPYVDRVVYEYDEDTRMVYDSEELELSERSYTGKYDGDDEACAEGHDYQLDGWIWNDDRSSASAVFVCSRNRFHAITVSADVSTEMKLQEGRIVNTAVVSEETSPDHLRHETSIALPYTGWYTSPDNKTYFFNNRGGLSKGWVSIQGNWYYFNVEGVMQTGWKQLSGKWYYLGGDGVMRTGWQKIGGKWYYLESSGAMATGWKQISGKWYYLDKSGIMATGWKQLSGKWYYLGGDGVMRTGWQKIGGKWYYLESSGAMATGWKQISGKWYYLDSSGAMAVGWKQISGKWYYLDSSGVMVTGWKQLAGKWYYLDSSGVMVTGRKQISGKWYTFGSDGALVN